MKKSRAALIDKVFVGILLVIFGGIVLHAPLSVGLSTLFPAYEVWFQSWKEILMAVAAVLSLVALHHHQQWRMLREPLLLAVAAYGLLHVALIPLFPQSVDSTLAGLMIDLRYVLFFGLVYIAVRLYPSSRRKFLVIGLAGALIVAVFALLQVTVLPHDVLKYLGYGPSTIMPFLTVDQNMDFIRINSTLRGPNPLGAFAAISLTLLLAFWLRGNHRQLKRPMFVIALLGIGSIAALWFSYSRSALLAAGIAAAVVIFIVFARHASRWVWIGLAAGLIVAGGLLYAARDNHVVSTVILHEDPSEGGAVNSNDGHIDSLADGVARMVRQPFGGGIGSTGSPSLLGDQPLIIENQYLYIAHEVGWLGLAVFLVIFWKIMKALWQRRRDWLALGVFATGIGLALANVLLPVWADDTVGIIWWGLAAVSLGGIYGERTLNKKAKRTA